MWIPAVHTRSAQNDSHNPYVAGVTTPATNVQFSIKPTFTTAEYVDNLGGIIGLFSFKNSSEAAIEGPNFAIGVVSVTV